MVTVVMMLYTIGTTQIVLCMQSNYTPISYILAASC